MQRAIVAVSKALAALGEELGLHERGQGRVSNPIELRAIHKQLVTIREHLVGELPVKEDRVKGLGRNITDSWPFDNELGALIIAAENAYLAIP